MDSSIITIMANALSEQVIETIDGIPGDITVNEKLSVLRQLNAKLTEHEMALEDVRWENAKPVDPSEPDGVRVNDNGLRVLPDDTVIAP